VLQPAVLPASSSGCGSIVVIWVVVILIEIVMSLRVTFVVTVVERGCT
jgi:hypothetical protein